MHYLTELANKLVATYRTGDASGDAGQSEEERRKLVAALRCALELETGKGKREESASNLLTEYGLSDAYPSSVAMNKD